MRPLRSVRGEGTLKGGQERAETAAYARDRGRSTSRPRRDRG